MTDSSCVFPPEILQRPRPLVYLCGLDQSNPTHKTIWESFSTHNRPNASLSVKLVDFHLEVPKSKTKRTLYECYIPKGILKCNWIDKHLNHLPSVVAVFSELNWEEGDLRGKQQECIDRVEHIRQALQGQQTKIVLVLIQKRTVLPPGVDPVATDYATQLCQGCNLPIRSLFAISLSEDTVIDGYIKRLHEELLGLANAYYQAQAKMAKSHREYLNKTTHALLFVRHHFKIAFFSEMQQIPSKPEAQTAQVLRYYKLAYSNLTEGTVRIYDTNLMEIKTVGGFINYKICKLHFQNNQPVEAIQQFKLFVEYFKLKHGPQKLIFEHYAWLSKQFSIFAELFEEAVEIGLSAVQIQHPGFYYQQAAYLTMQRRESANIVCVDVPHLTQNEVSTLQLEQHHGTLEFWGQRPWRQGIQSIDPPDLQKEKAGLQLLQQAEMLVNYSPIIIPLLNSAVTQFKKFKCARMRRWMIVQVGQEYSSGFEYNNALKFFMKVLPEYRREAWLPLFSNVLQMALNCAYSVADVEKFTTLCIEAMGNYCTLGLEYKQTVQMNLLQMFAGTVPHPPQPSFKHNPGTVVNYLVDKPEESSNPQKLWLQKLSAPEGTKFTVDMSKITAFISMKCTFEKDSFFADEPICVRVFLYSMAPFPIRFSKLSLKFSNPSYDPHCVLIDAAVGSEMNSDTGLGDQHSTGDHSGDGDRFKMADLVVNPFELKSVKFTFFAEKNDVCRKLEIGSSGSSSLILQLGQNGKQCALLSWTGIQSETHLLDQVHKSNEYFLIKLPSFNCDEPYSKISDIPLRGHCNINPRESQVSIRLTHNPPVLVNEWFKLDVTIENKELQPINNIKVDIVFVDQKRLGHMYTPQISLDWPAQEDDAKISQIHRDFLEPIQPGDKIFLTLFIRCFNELVENLLIKISHDVDVERSPGSASGNRTGANNYGYKKAFLNCSCSKEETITLSVVKPFDILSRVATMTLDPLETIHGQEQFLIMTTITALSPWPIKISNATFELNCQVSKIEETDGVLDGIKLKPTETANIVCAAKTNPMPLPNTLNLGKLYIKWQREPVEPNLPLVSSSLDVSPLHNVDPVPISIKADLPPFGHVQQPMHVKYFITNNTDMLQDITIQVESADDNMLFSGNKNLNCRLLPGDTRSLNYTIIPIAVGFCKLPTINMYLMRLNKEMGKLVKQLTPSELYVKPAHTFLGGDNSSVPLI